MKSYINYEGNEIFKLDDFGNLWLMGNLNLGTHGVLTSPGGIIAPSDADICVVRDPREMEPPFTKEGSAIYYLGETVEEGQEYQKDGVTYTYSQDYVYGAWFEKYVYGYDCVIDTESITVENFSTPAGTAFRVLGSGLYAHNKAMLDAYPDTVKIILTAVPAVNDDPGYWEIKYYDVDNTLLYNDTLSDNLLDHSDYHFPFSPLDANEYGLESADIPINVTTVYATKQVNPVDFTLYMEKSGGKFEGLLKTQNIQPDPDAITTDGLGNPIFPYSIGTNENRYFRGYFQELVAKTVNAEELHLESLVVDSFGLSEGKTDISAGDALIIADSQAEGALKRAYGITFNGDQTKFLRQDGTFATPKVVVPAIESFSEVEWAAGTMIYYAGTSNAFFTKGIVYQGIASASEYQITIEGATFTNNKVTNAGIFTASALNASSRLITAINALNIGTVASYIETQGYITLVYSDDVEGWYIDGQKDRGVVSKATTLAGVTNEELIDELISDNHIFETSVASDETIKVTINTFLWKPLNTVTFDGVSTNKYLSQAGTWEDIPEVEGGGSSTPGFTPAEETGEVGSQPYYYVLGSVSVNSTTGVVTVLGVDDLVTPGLYELRGGTSDPDFTLAVKNVLNTIYQTITTIKWNEADKTFVRTIPDRLMRKGSLNVATGTVTWENWVHVYSTAETRVTLDVKGTWRTLTEAEWDYLLTGRTNAATLNGLATVAGVPGLIILDDYGTLPSVTGAHFTAGDASGFATNTYTATEWNKYYSSLMVFLPCTGKRVGTTVSDTKDKTTPMGGYWTATQSQAYEEGVTDAETYALKILEASRTLTGYENETGLAVRLAKTSSNGVFSVAANRRVIFSKGNLQYHPANGIFRFARNQYDTIDEFNMNLNALYEGWVDLFGYGTSGVTGAATQTTNISDDPDDFTKEDIEGNPDLDWGQFNSIYTVAKPTIASCLDEAY